MDIEVAPGAVSAEIDGATVVLAPDMRFLRLDETGAAIWQFIVEGRNSVGVVDALCQRYAVDRETANADVRGFLQNLADLGLVTLND